MTRPAPAPQPGRHRYRTRDVRGRSALVAALAWTTVLAGACGRGSGDEARAGSAAVPASPAVAARTSVPGVPACQNTGRWDACNVEKRLEQAGLAPQRVPGEVRLPFMAVPALRYRVGHDTVDVFLYRSAADVRRDVARLDTVRVQPRDTTVAWSATPTFMTSNNMAAILLSDRPRQIERVRLALTAGLPAPDEKGRP